MCQHRNLCTSVIRHQTNFHFTPIKKPFLANSVFERNFPEISLPNLQGSQTKCVFESNNLKDLFAYHLFLENRLRSLCLPSCSAANFLKALFNREKTSTQNLNGESQCPYSETQRVPGTRCATVRCICQSASLLPAN